MSQRRRTWAAFAVAIAVLFQSVLSIASAAVMPLAPQLDAFGNPLCITSVDHTKPSQEQEKLPACCGQGCSVTWSALPAPSLSSTAVDWPDHHLAWVPQLQRTDAVLRPTDRPGRLRDPPHLSH